MKIFYLECTEEELSANRGIMDAIVDACNGVLNTFYGSYRQTDETVEESEEEEDTHDHT